MSAFAIRSCADDRIPDIARFGGVALREQLLAAGISPQVIDAQLRALNWRRIGPAIVLHYQALTPAQVVQAALWAHGPQSVLGSFTALQQHGLEGWERGEIDIVAPPGISAYQHPELPPVVLHTDVPVRAGRRRRLEPPATALVRAGASCLSERIACGVLAAAVHQGVVRPVALSHELGRATVRHREAMLAAATDMQQHDDALADLDLSGLCAARYLPAPVFQRPRELAGRRRYLEVAWELPDGKPFIVEVDGALHLAARRWWEDELRPSDLTVTAAGVLRIPSAVLRHEPEILLNVLRRSLTEHRQVG